MNNRLLVSAVKNNYPTIVKKLLKNGANPNIYIGDYHSLLTYSIKYGYNKISEFLLEAGANPNTPNALSNAVNYGNIEIIDYLVEKNVVIPSDIMFDVHWYGPENYEKTMKKLISYGVDINYMKNNKTMLTTEFYHNNCKQASILLKLGANPNIHNFIFIPILYAIVKCQDSNMLELLLKKGADVNVQDLNGCTPLMCVVYYYSSSSPYYSSLSPYFGEHSSKIFLYKYIKLLLNYGADLTLREINGNNIFDFIEDYVNNPDERNEINKILLEYKTEPIKVLTHASKKGKMPLPVDLVREVKNMLYYGHKKSKKHYKRKNKMT